MQAQHLMRENVYELPFNWKRILYVLLEDPIVLYHEADGFSRASVNAATLLTLLQETMLYNSYIFVGNEL